MFKKIGIFTYIGISITLIWTILYINSLYERNFSVDYVFWISGFFLGLLFVIIDILYIEKRDKIKILDYKRLGVYIKIVLVGFAALVIGTVLLTIFIFYLASILYYIICITIFIPAIIIGLIIFLILIRTSYAKIVESKNIKFFYIIIVLLIIILPMILSWHLLFATQQDRLNIEHLELSSDGTRLLLYSKDHYIISPKADQDGKLCDNYIWDTQTGEILLHETAKSRIYFRISPDGNYIINEQNKTIISVSTGEIVGRYHGDFQSWSRDGKYFATTSFYHSLIRYNDFFIWNMSNFSVCTSFEGINHNYVELSPDGAWLVLYDEKNLIKMYKTFSENTSVLWNKTNVRYGSVAWSENGDQLQIIYYKPFGNISEEYQLLIINVSDGQELYNTSFEVSLGKGAENKIVHKAFGLYVFYDADKDKLLFYNLSGLMKQYKIDDLRKFDLSYDRSVMAWGRQNGVVEIRNGTSGKLIRTLKTPLYEFEKGTPGFEIVTLIIAIVFLLLWKRRKSS